MYRSSRISASAVLSCAVLVLVACNDHTPTAPLSPATLSRVASAERVARVAICPTSRSHRTTGILGTAGGTLAVAGHRVTVPAGVLTHPTPFVLYAPAGGEVKLELTAGHARHAEFSGPVTVTISYDRCERQHGPKGVATAWYRNDRGARIRFEPMGGTDDRRQRAVSFETTHFSTYVVAY